jgi:hypothetical protein
MVGLAAIIVWFAVTQEKVLDPARRRIAVSAKQKAS